LVFYSSTITMMHGPISIRYVVVCYAVIWQHVIGMVCVLFTVLSVWLHSTQRTVHIPYL